MTELIPNIPEHVVALRKTGEDDEDDYENVFVPAVKQAKETYDKIRLLYQIETEPDPNSGNKVGLKEFAQFERIALVTDFESITSRVKTFSFMIPCKIRVFPIAELEEAKTWITE